MNESSTHDHSKCQRPTAHAPGPCHDKMPIDALLAYRAQLEAAIARSECETATYWIQRYLHWVLAQLAAGGDAR